MRTVLANGCWDPLHYGHILHLRAARKMGRVVVSVTGDLYINKGAGRPVFTENQRMDMLRELKCVSEVFVCMDALDALIQSKPDIFVKGKEYEGKIEQEDLEYCQQQGIQIVFTDEITYSSTKLLHHYA